jgi:hypothetical protein
MSVVKGLIIGIILVAVGLGMVLSSSTSILPWVGGLLGVVGAVIIVRTLLADRQHHY